MMNTMGVLLELVSTRQGICCKTSTNPNAMFLCNTCGLTEEQRGSVDEISAINHYVDCHINETVKQQNFRQCAQHPGKPFDNFLVCLRDLVKICNFCSDACIQKSLRDQITEGLLDNSSVNALL